MSEFPLQIESELSPEQIRQQERRRLFDNLSRLQEQYFERLKSQPYRLDYILRNLDKLSDYVTTAKLAAEIKQTLETLNSQSPDGEDCLVFEIYEDQTKAEALVNLYQTEGKTQQLVAAIGRYLQRFSFSEKSRLPSKKEIQEKELRWNRLDQLFEKLDLENFREDKAGRLTANIKRGLGSYLRDQDKEGAHWEEIGTKIFERRRAVEKDGLFLAYYESVEDVEALLSSGRLLSIFELPEGDQGQERKSWRTLSEVKRDRQQIEQALGWAAGSPVYHLVLERDADLPQTNYGPVRLIFDFEKLKGYATFTLGDSLNDGGVPDSLRDAYVREKADSALRRQVDLIHLSLAKALFELASEQTMDSSPIRYLEAQVGGLSGQEIFGALKEIRINSDERQDLPVGTVERIKGFCEGHGIIFSS
ncbi:MAG: hypothetical protein V1716_03220 [Candidatus Uhrbacteria bacterium]